MEIRVKKDQVLKNLVILILEQEVVIIFVNEQDLKVYDGVDEFMYDCLKVSFVKVKVMVDVCLEIVVMEDFVGKLFYEFSYFNGMQVVN